jgi:hypothetical protein
VEIVETPTPELPTPEPLEAAPTPTPEPDILFEPPDLDSIEIITEKTSGYILQTTTLDLDGDGVAEQISAYFLSDDDLLNASYIEIYTCEIVVIKADVEYKITWHEASMRPQLNFADFDTRDAKIQFYIESDGPSGDPYTQIFSFDGTQIIKNTGFPGFITSYDGLGRIYSDEIYSVNCYFDLNNGLTPLPKDNIVGTEIQRDFNIILCSTMGEFYTSAILSHYYDENLEFYIQHFEEQFICLVPVGTPLIVLDIEFVTYPWDENELNPVPWLKVRTPDGTEGWFGVFYGD